MQEHAAIEFRPDLAKSGSMGFTHAAAVREELDRILRSASFRNSKRYSEVLKLLVDRTLEGRGEELKERTIGIEIFKRPPDYDTGADHSARSSASEIRKRLAQYYQQASSKSGIRIELHPGSYVPTFQVEEPKESSTTVVEAFPDAEEPVRTRRWLIASLVAAFVLLLTGGMYAIRSRQSTTALDRFWRPVVAQPGSVVVCVGRHISNHENSASSTSPAPPETVTESRFNTGRGFLPSDLVTGGNAIALAQIAGQLQARKKPIRFFLAASASFEDFQERSVVLVGGPNNQWTIHMLAPLRFRLGEPGTPIVDTANSGKSWMPEENLRDYAIVARFVNSQTGQIMVIAAGTHVFGTVAAGQFLSDESLLSQLQAQAPRNWEHMNLEVVLDVDVVGGVGGRPKIVATHFW